MKNLTLMKVSLSLSFIVGLVAAGSVFYADDASALRGESSKTTGTFDSASEEPSAETIAAWKATASASDYIRPQVPI